MKGYKGYRYGVFKGGGKGKGYGGFNYGFPGFWDYEHHGAQMSKGSRHGKWYGFGKGRQDFQDVQEEKFYHPIYKMNSSRHPWYSCTTPGCRGIFKCGEDPPSHCIRCSQPVEWTNMILAPKDTLHEKGGFGFQKGAEKGKEKGKGKGKQNKDKPIQKTEVYGGIIHKLLQTDAADTVNSILTENGVQAPAVAKEAEAKPNTSEELIKKIEKTKRDIKNIEGYKKGQIQHLQSLVSKIGITEQKINTFDERIKAATETLEQSEGELRELVGASTLVFDERKVKSDIDVSFGKLSKTFESMLSFSPPQDPGQFAQVWKDTFGEIVQSLATFRTDLLQAVSIQSEVQQTVQQTVNKERVEKVETVNKHPEKSEESASSAKDPLAAAEAMDVEAMEEELASTGVKRLRINTDSLHNAAEVVQSADAAKLRAQGIIESHQSAAESSTAKNTSKEAS